VTYVREPTYEISYFFRRVLVPFDGSAASVRALKIALDFAKRYGSRVVVFIVDDGSMNVDDAKKKVEGEALSAGVNVDVKIAELNKSNQSTATRIIEEAVNGNYDIVILAARGRTISEEVIIGSTALSVIINVPMSVLLIR